LTPGLIVIAEAGFGKYIGIQLRMGLLAVRDGLETVGLRERF